MITPSFHIRNCPHVRSQEWESNSGQIAVRRVLSPLCHQCSHLCRWFKFRDNTIISVETTCFVFSQNTGSEVDALDLALAHAHAHAGGKVMAWQNNLRTKSKIMISRLLFPLVFRWIYYFQFERANQINPCFHRPIKRVLLVDVYNNKLLCNGKWRVARAASLSVKLESTRSLSSGAWSSVLFKNGERCFWQKRTAQKSLGDERRHTPQQRNAAL